MKLLIASDIHGSAYYCRKLLEAYVREGAQRMVLLGDILYHGPRNDLPKEYAPKEVIAMLNAHKNEIYAVRGNCEAEVDQMVLEFPVLADYMVLFAEKNCESTKEGAGETAGACAGSKCECAVYATHGHVYNEKNLPPMKPGDVLLHGHTHVLRAERAGDIWILNPGSVSIPKEGNPPTYAVLDGGVFTIKDFEGTTVKEIEL